MMNAISFQSHHFVSVTECVSSRADNAKGINLSPFVNVRNKLNGLRHPDNTHDALLAYSAGQNISLKFYLSRNYGN